MIQSTEKGHCVIFKDPVLQQLSKFRNSIESVKTFVARWFDECLAVWLENVPSTCIPFQSKNIPKLRPSTTRRTKIFAILTLYTPSWSCNEVWITDTAFSIAVAVVVAGLDQLRD